MKHTASARFWRCYDALPGEVRALADKNFELMKRDASHPSLQFKRVGSKGLFSARVG